MAEEDDGEAELGVAVDLRRYPRRRDESLAEWKRRCIRLSLMAELRELQKALAPLPSNIELADAVRRLERVVRSLVAKC